MSCPDVAQASAGLHLDHVAVAETLLERKPILRTKIAAACRTSDGEETVALAEVLRFVSLVAAHEGGLTPSVRVDDAWHEFVLCTRLYASWCEQTLGRFVHHDPGGTEALNRERFKRTLTLYAEAFGAPPTRWWGHRMHSSEPADCGACEGTLPPCPSPE